MKKNKEEFNFLFSKRCSQAVHFMKMREFKLKDPVAEHIFSIYFKKLRDDGHPDIYLKSTDMMYLDIPDINTPFPFKKRT